METCYDCGRQVDAETETVFHYGNIYPSPAVCEGCIKILCAKIDAKRKKKLRETEKLRERKNAMGTHGRNAVTRNGVHECYEQTMDGYDACLDLVKPFLFAFDGTIPSLSPTMDDRTDECDQCFFAHVDYDAKELYCSQQDPQTYLLKLASQNETDCREALNVPSFDYELIEVEMGIDRGTDEMTALIEEFETVMKNVKALAKLGWKVYFDTYDCPADSGCVNGQSD